MPSRKSGKVRVFRLLFLVIFLITVFFAAYKITSIPDKKPETDILSAITAASPKDITPPPGTGQNKSLLGQFVQHELAGTQGFYGIAVVNFRDRDIYLYNENRSFESASLYKLWVMATVYQQIQEGKLHESDMLSQDADTLNKEFAIASESAEFINQKITYSVRDAMIKMITVSDNYAALLLTEKVGLPAVAFFLKNNGFLQSQLGSYDNEPVTTAHDVALFFVKLYNKQLADPVNTDKMLTLLKWQKLNSKLPKYLPASLTIAHKTGELDQFSHDAGIVYTPTGDYIIVVLTETDSRPLAEERISNISEAVYKYITE